ncbi:unnamed protein product [Rotaria sordida]|uniref:TLDc domain-containing protein n=1 Tax=Rotaria sordida TaxID=392033 RepID=A0A813NE88_9BILA|nr:unnamed protein product [Rotaria sordida]CAF3509558.1 unnamed protein product [Rotaria sordida]
MSQTNGVTTATITNNKININNNSNDNNNNNNNGSELEILQNLQTLVPAIKQNFILMSQQFTQFINYTEDFNKLSTTIRSMQIKQEQLERELEQYRKDRNDIGKQFEINSDNRIYLDVGGQRFTTTIKTLTQSTNSIFFQTLINEKWNVNTNSIDIPIFIDRDGRLFDVILQYLRTGELNIEDRKIQKELLTEAKYYKLKNLEDELNLILRKDELFMSINSFDAVNQSPPCSPLSTINKSRSSPFSPTPLSNNITRLSPLNQSISSKLKLHPAQTASSWRSNLSSENRLNIFLGSTLLTIEYEEKLIEFIGNDIQQQPWRLIYRASEHGFDATDFHRYCDSFAPTVSIIQTDFGNIFGGFTSIPWSSASLRSDQADPKAFLFTLKNTLNIPPTKFPVAKEYQQCAISHNPTCGPNFGSPKNEGSDLCLRNKFNDKTNCIFFPKSYIDSTNQGGLIFAKKYFACKEVEIFTLMANS